MKRRSLRRPEELFNDAVERLRAGGSADVLLQEHPEQAAELTALLDTVAGIRAERGVPVRPPEIAAASRERFMAAARALPAATRKPYGLFAGIAAGWTALAGSFAGPRRVSYALAVLLTLVLLFGLSTTQVIIASASALPGVPLFQIKLASEQLQLLLARDEASRQEIEQAIAARRIAEAKAITQLRRPVASMRIVGLLEAINDAEWQVAGLKLRITPETRITGRPAVGAMVRGSVQAPGDGSLIALELHAAAPQRTGDAPAAMETPTPTASATPATATAHATEPAAAQPPATWTAEPAAPPAAAQTTATAAPTPAPLPTGTATRTPTATRTRAPSPTAGPSPTPLRPTPPISRKFGTVTQIDGYLWTIREVDTPPLQVLVDASTEWVNNPQLGDRVEVVFAPRGGALVATRIVRTGGPVATPEPFDFSGLIQELNGEWWKVRGISFRVSPETEIEGDPAIDRFAEVHAERRAGEEIWARRITVKTLPEYEFTGAIEETGPSSLRVRGVTVSIDQRTQYLGDPPMVGRLADVQAVQIGEGRLMARIVYT